MTASYVAEGDKHSYLQRVAIWAAVLLTALPALACDMCSIYNATDIQEGSITGVHVGFAEQYTDYGTLQQGGHQVANPGNEHMHSSISQLVLGYQPRQDVGLQLNLPIITRRFRRNTETGSQHGDSSGVGDLSLLFRYRPLRMAIGPVSLRGWVAAGVELPTGSADRLGEELDEDHHPEKTVKFYGSPRHEEHGGVESGIHGHDLALGSGSVDAIFGGDLLLNWDRLFAVGSLQYRLRNAGSFDYEYADELTAHAGPGVFILLNHEYSFAARATVSVDTKGNDQRAGVRANDTALTALYAGPGLQFTWRDKLNLEIGADLPAILNNSGLQAVPDYRIRAGFIWSL